MMTRNKAVKARYKPHTGVEAGIRELRRFCLDLKKLVMSGCGDRTDEIAGNRAITTATQRPWAAGLHSGSRTRSRQ